MQSVRIGKFQPELATSKKHLAFSISPAAFPLRWSLCSQTANFIAEYCATVFGQDAPTVELRHTVSYVANELMENAFKYHFDRTTSIDLQLRKGDGDFYLFVRNSVDPANIEKFQAFLQELSTNDPGEMYARQIEENMLAEERGEPPKSGLGFITMLMNHDVEVGWSFESDTHNTTPVVMLSTIAQIPITKELLAHGNQD